MDYTNELGKALRTKGLGKALKNYPSNRQETIVGAKWFLYFSIGPILLIIFSNYRPIQISVAIIHVLFCVGFLLAYVFNMYYQGMMQGAKRTLENPPPIGETYIEFTEDGEQIWKSEKIIFEPSLPESDNGNKAHQLDISNKWRVPKFGSKKWVEWRNRWEIVRPFIGKKNNQEIIAYLETHERDLACSEDTLRNNIGAGQEGEFK